MQVNYCLLLKMVKLNKFIYLEDECYGNRFEERA